MGSLSPFQGFIGSWGAGLSFGAAVAVLSLSLRCPKDTKYPGERLGWLGCYQDLCSWMT